MPPAASKTIAVNGRDISIPTGLFINGEFVEALGHGQFSVEDPSTGKQILSISEGQPEDVDVAVKAARKALKDAAWASSDPTYRSKLLNKLADLLEENIEDIVHLECADTGKTYRQCRNSDLPDTVETLRYYAGWTDKVLGQTNFTIPETFAYTRREPIGVCGQIIPWKYVQRNSSQYLILTD